MVERSGNPGTRLASEEDPEPTAWCPGMPSVLPSSEVPTLQLQAVAQQACDACFAGDNQARTPLDQDAAVAPAFPDGSSAALYLTALMAGFAAALNGCKEIKKINPR